MKGQLKILFLILAAAFVAGCGGGGGQLPEGLGDSGNYFPFAEGDTWTYRNTSSSSGIASSAISGKLSNLIGRSKQMPVAKVSAEDFHTTIITGTKILNGVTVTVFTLGTEENYYLKDSSGITYYGNNDHADTITAQLIPYRMVNFPLTTGSSFVQINKTGLDAGEDLDGDGKNDAVDVYSTVTVAGFETVTVPAGTFPDCARIETNLSTTFKSSLGYPSITVIGVNAKWVAPGIGIVKETSALTIGSTGYSETATYELTGYTVNGKSVTADTTLPMVSSTNPSSRAIGVAVNSAVYATFSEAMDMSTINTANFTVISTNGSNVSGTVTYDATKKVATFTPSENLAYSTTYTATITADVNDLAGNKMAANYIWSFTTSLEPDITPPAVSSTNPLNGATAVAATTVITATFSEAMDPSTITTDTFTLGGGVTGTISYNASTRTATFTPSGNLAFNTTYTAMITTGAKDTAGNAMSTNYIWSFTTGVNINSLNFRVIDAEYSKSLNRIIIVSTAPINQLHIYDPITEQDTTVNLNLAPTSVSVSPDGLYAAVGHNAWISYVNLSTATLLKTLSVTADVLDIVLAGNGYVYAFPRIDQWEYIRCVNIATEAETPSTGGHLYAGTKGKLHPGGTSIYGANNGLSPSDIEKYDISAGTAFYLHDSPYHGDYAMCGDLWMSEDGLRIFTRCGNVFRASSVQAEDMTYNGALQNLNLVRHLSHSSAIGKVAAIPYDSWNTTNADTEIRIFGYDYLTFEESITLPQFIVGSNHYAGHGRFVFYNSDGTKYFVVLQADGSSGMLYDYGVVTYQ